MDDDCHGNVTKNNVCNNQAPSNVKHKLKWWHFPQIRKLAVLGLINAHLDIFGFIAATHKLVLVVLKPTMAKA